MITRIVLYAVGALAGVYVTNLLRPVELDTTGALGAASGGLDAALTDIFAGKFSDAGSALLTGAKAGGAAAKAQVQGQVRTTVVLGVVAGCSVAGLVDAFVLRT